MSAVLAEPRLTHAEWAAMMREPTKDKAYLATRLGPSIVASLAWLRLGGRSEETLDQYERDLARLAVTFPELGIAEITTGDLMVAMELFPPGSWKRVRAAWGNLFEWANTFDHRPDNPLRRLPKLKATPPPVYDIFSAGEQAALINAGRQTEIPAVDVARVHLKISTGTRRGEEMGIQVKHVNLAERFVVVTGKGDKQRLIPIRGEAIRAFEEFLLTPLPIAPKHGGPRLPRAEDYVWFPTRMVRFGKTPEQPVAAPWKPISKTAYWSWWKRIAELAQIPYRKGHMARHTYATETLDATSDLYSVMELLGHSSTSVTEVYIHSSRTRLAAAVERLMEARKASQD